MKTKQDNSSQDSTKKINALQFPYNYAIEIRMTAFYKLLSEKHKRLYAASEALKLCYGGITYISKVLQCDRNTIRRGIYELKNPETIEKNNIRAKGGGRRVLIVSLKLMRNF